MKTLVCRHCGCSLVRLGINEDKAVAYPPPASSPVIDARGGGGCCGVVRGARRQAAARGRLQPRIRAWTVPPSRCGETPAQASLSADPQHASGRLG